MYCHCSPIKRNLPKKRWLKECESLIGRLQQLQEDFDMESANLDSSLEAFLNLMVTGGGLCSICTVSC
uniref:Uncharacterized protein n=1 Tax=Arundo donax TaxID=35708 RepID=A0A0A8YE81_ARUDO